MSGKRNETDTEVSGRCAVTSDGRGFCTVVPVTVEQAGAELSRLGECADEPERALVHALERMGAADFDRRQRLLGALQTFLRQSGRDWDRLIGTHAGAGVAMGVDVATECRSLHEAQLAELLERVGEAL